VGNGNNPDNQTGITGDCQDFVIDPGAGVLCLATASVLGLFIFQLLRMTRL
jgi:hypothetical protein